MENNIQDQSLNHLTLEEERPQFLKTICILSFICSGLMILLYSIGIMSLALDEEMIAGFWTKIVERNAEFEDVDPVAFFHDFGMVCIYFLIANIFSLIGVIMMWRLQKAGFIIYAIAELVTNFFSIDTGNEKSYGWMIFLILIDLAFIVMYFLNLKYMGKKRDTNTITSVN